ncbi:MAG: 16S rRNA (guanine(966)-N(2))-methyltransferase RsmD [Bacillota bacterium]
MRIIGGSDRGRKLSAPEGVHTRPTLDKVRGAIFNVLFDVSGSEVLDLFGGSGAMGFEALSRGAAKAVIVENDRAAFRVIEKNKDSLSYGDRADLRFADFRRALRGGERFDIIFLDPPYRGALLEEALAMIEKENRLKEGGVIVAETDLDKETAWSSFSYRIVKEKRYGKTRIIFLKT